MNKYNPEELKAAIKAALDKGVKKHGMYNCLFYMPDNKQNSEGYVNAKRFGYDCDTGEFNYLGDVDIMPCNIDYEDYRMDFVPEGIQLFRKDRRRFNLYSMQYL